MLTILKHTRLPYLYMQEADGTVTPIIHKHTAVKMFRAFVVDNSLYGAWDRSLGAAVYYTREAAYAPTG